MKQKIQRIKLNNESTAEGKSVKKIKNGLILVFSLCAASLFIFFTASENIPLSKDGDSALVSVFKETYLNELLDLENCENVEGSV